MIDHIKYLCDKISLYYSRAVGALLVYYVHSQTLDMLGCLNTIDYGNCETMWMTIDHTVLGNFFREVVVVGLELS